MANLLQISLNRALDSNGDPISGAKLKFYLTGTTTAASWFTDQAGTAAGTNPLTADANGIFAPAYLDPDVTYRIIHADDTDATIWDVDPVLGYDVTAIDADVIAAAASAEASAASAEVSAASAAADAIATAADRVQTGLDVASAAANAATAQTASDAAISGVSSAGTYVATTLVAAQTTGLAAVAEGETFYASGDDVTYIGLYTDLSGVATEVVQIAKPSALDAAVASIVNVSAKSPISYALSTADYATKRDSARRKLISHRSYASPVSTAAVSHSCGIGAVALFAAGDAMQAIEFPIAHALSGDTYTLDVYQRPLSSANLNTAPSVGDDELVETIANLNPTVTQNMVASIYVYQPILFTLTNPLFPKTGYEIVVRLTCKDSGGTDKTFKVHYATIAGTDQYLKGWYRPTSGGAWSNIGVGKSMRFAVFAPAEGATLKVYAEPSKLSAIDREIYQWVQRTYGGVNQPAPIDGRILVGSYPGTATTGNGLEKLVTGNAAASSWPTDMMQVATDFGQPTGLGTGTDPNTHPNWDAGSSRVLVRDTTALANQTLDNYNFDAAKWLNISNGSSGQVSVSNSVFDGDTTRVYGIDQTGFDKSNLSVLRSEFTRQQANSIKWREGHLDRLYMHDGEADALRFQGGGAKRLTRSLTRKLGLGVGAHGDCTQMSGSGVYNFIGFQNTYYMPGTGSTYDEGVNGSTNIHNWNTDGGDGTGYVAGDFASVNELLIGGGYTVSVCADTTDEVNGVAFIGSWWSLHPSLGGDYSLFGNFYPGKAGNIGTTKNILIHNCRCIEDLSPVQKSTDLLGGLEDAHGLWDYDKATAPANFLRFCKILGYVDDNGDPLVPVRTGFHIGTIV